LLAHLERIALKLARLLLVALLFAAAPAGADSITELALPANDLVYDSTSGLIYASVPGRAGAAGNSITRINPLTGQIVGSVFVGSEPGTLAATDDGQYLYVSLDGQFTVRRYSILTNTPDPLMPSLPTASQLVTLPGLPQSVAILGGSFPHAGIGVFDNGAARTYTSPAYPIAFLSGLAGALSPNRLYALGSFDTLSRLDLRLGAFSTLDALTIPGGIPYSGNRSQGGLLFSPYGAVVDPEAGTVQGTFTNGNPLISQSLVCPDLPNGRVFFLARESFQTYSLRAFDARTYTLLGSIPLPPLEFDPSSLIRWGADGLAFQSGDTVYLVRTSLVPQDSPTVDLEVTAPATLPATPAGETLTYAISVRNAGANTATFASLTDSLPPTAAVISATASQGQVYPIGGVITVRLGALPAGAAATLTVEVRFSTPGEVTHTVRATAFEADTDAQDDQLTQSVSVGTAVKAELNLEWAGVKVVCPRRGKCRFTGKVRIRNQGGTDARKFVVRFYRSSDLVLNGDDFLIDEVKIARLAKGKSSTVKLNAKSYPGGSPYYVLAMVDAAGEVAEADETDNVAASTEL